MSNTLREAIMVAAMEGDLARLLSLGRDGLGRPLLLGGETLNVLGWSGPPAMPREAVWEDYIREGFAPNFQWSDELFESNSLDLARGFSVCYVPHPEDNCAYWIVDIEMMTSQPVHLILSGKGRPDLPPPDAELLSLICLAIRTCLNNRGATQPNERFSSEYLMLQLIRHKNFDEPLLRFRAQEVHMESEGYFALLLIDLKGYHPRRNSVATIHSLLSAVLNGFSVIDGEVLAFLICHETDDNEEKRQVWHRVEPILRENKLFGLFSRTFYRLGDFHYHYVHTQNTLKLRFCAQPGQCLAACDDLALYSMIHSLRESDALALPMHPIIDQLQHSDQTRKTAYVETLSAYLAHSQKPAPTCEQLHIHRNTLDYRLRRMEELTDLDWGDGDLMFRLYFSLCAIRYEQLSRGAEGL